MAAQRPDGRATRDHSTALSARQRGLGYVPQGQQSFPQMTALENLQLITTDSGPIITHCSGRLTSTFTNSWVRASEEDEVTGLDQTQHAESAYELGGIGSGGGGGSSVTGAPTGPVLAAGSSYS